MAIEVELFCPMGRECEEAVDGKLLRCRWYKKVSGKLPDGTDVDEEDCSISWMPYIGLEMSKTNRGQTLALEQMTQAMDRNQRRAIEALNKGTLNEPAKTKDS